MGGRYETILYEKKGPVGILTLNRPDRLNALAPELVAEVGDCLDAIEKDDEVRVVILTGAGRAFSAGFDLKEEAGKPWGTVEVVKPILERCFGFIVRFWHFPKPTISAVNGYALAGGCELALCCDMTVMAEEAYLGEPELRFGSGIVALIMPWLIGPKKAKEWILTGEDRIDAQQALQWGLVNRVVPAAELHDRVDEMAERLLKVPALTLRNIKRLIATSLDTALETQLYREIEAFSAAVAQPEFGRLVKGFVDKSSRKTGQG